MASEELIRFVIYYFALPFFTWIGIIIVLAALGKSFGVRRLYIEILLIIFEWGREKITAYTDDKWGKQRIKIHEKTHPTDIVEDDEQRVQPVSTQVTPVTPVKSTGFSTIAEETEDEVASTDQPGQSERGDDLSEASREEHAKKDESTYKTAEKLTPNGDADEHDETLTTELQWGVPDQYEVQRMVRRLYPTPSGHLINREIQVSSHGTNALTRRFSINQETYHEFKLADIMYFCKSGIESIVEDEVTQRFSAEELSSWNLLTRTNTKHEFISVRLTLLWFAGWVLRYIILFPFRLTLAAYAIGLLICGTAIIGYIPDPKTKRWLYARLNLMCYRVMGRAFSAIVNFHNKQNRAKGGGICVANHTSPIDIIILSADNTYAMVGQSQPGFIGIIQRAMSRAETHVWFERAEARDRMAVASRLKEHVEDTNKLPILIFPEGTCINNTSIMMFKKGSFEVGGTIYPVAIKYDPRFADCFWNSSQQSFVKHMLMIMTSWALVCDVWYLPPEIQKPGESAVDFANRVKANIAAQGGLVDLEWDGGLKRSQPKSSMMQKQQEEYSKKLKGE